MTTPDPRGITPKLKAGCAWINRPHRSLSFLTSDSNIPILNPRNRHHFILLAKYRPQITFIKAPTAWTGQLGTHGNAAIKLLNSKSTHRTTSSYRVVTLKRTNHGPVLSNRPSNLQLIYPALVPGQPGWPQLHTALRCITRQKPRGKVSNEELYASLRKPSAVDILGANWRDQHKQTQNKLLQKASFRSILQRPVPNEAVSSRISTARSMTHSVASSALLLRSSLNSLPTLTSQHRPPNVVTYTPLDKQPGKDSLAPDWKEHHKKRQERLLQQKETARTDSGDCSVSAIGRGRSGVRYSTVQCESYWPRSCLWRWITATCCGESNFHWPRRLSGRNRSRRGGRIRWRPVRGRDGRGRGKGRHLIVVASMVRSFLRLKLESWRTGWELSCRLDQTLVGMNFTATCTAEEIFVTVKVDVFHPYQISGLWPRWRLRLSYFHASRWTLDWHSTRYKVERWVALKVNLRPLPRRCAPIFWPCFTQKSKMKSFAN